MNTQIIKKLLGSYVCISYSIGGYIFGYLPGLLTHKCENGCPCPLAYIMVAFSPISVPTFALIKSF